MMARAWNRLRGRRSPEYTPLPVIEKDTEPKPRFNRRFGIFSIATAVQLIGALCGLYAAATILITLFSKSCDTVDTGYRCSPKTSHFWGQYSLWYAVPSEIAVGPPKGCEVTFANVLSRHGGRDPTIGKSMAYALLIANIKQTSTAFPGKFKFLRDYEYNLGADELTDAGRQEMVNSGVHFYRRYSKLVKQHTPFVRAGGQHRVIESAEKWLEGLAQSLHTEPGEVDLIIPESATSNNTLSHDNCPAMENGPSYGLGYRAASVWASQFVPPIQERVNEALGTNLSTGSIVSLMDMCPYDTLTYPTARVSEFCYIFTEAEWHGYDYYQTLGKFYGYGVGNPLGATQGVGYVNELLARLTGKPVQDNTNTNSTLDSDPATFPLGRQVYADFSHDNDMSGVFAALGLYNHTKPLSNTTIGDTTATHGYSAAWTVPFAARLYVEKLQCKQEQEELVRVIVNDRVHPLEFCDGDKYGRCTLSKFVESQSFARGGGLWHQCFE